MADGKPWMDVVFPHDSEMANIIRRKDWSTTSLGPIEAWPAPLQTVVSMCLATRFPMFVYWGPDRVQLYNDAGIPIMGAKHPHDALAPLHLVFPALWPLLAPMFDRIERTGQATLSDSQRLLIDRNGFLEEAFFSWSYSPIRDHTGDVVGFFTPAMETTREVQSARRLRMLQSIADRAAGAVSLRAACRAALTAFDDNPSDAPFALLYLANERGDTASLLAARGADPLVIGAPAEVTLRADAAPHERWVLSVAGRGGSTAGGVVSCEQAALRALPDPLGTGAAEAVVVLPLLSAEGERAFGYLVVGLSPRIALAGDYRMFLQLAAAAVATVGASARAQQEARETAEKLAALDRAKTAFFGNVSHELRTPLTLILGPIEDALQRSPAQLAGDDLVLVRRNAVRLFKMVNTLLDFTRIEAGRTQAMFAPTDLASLTRDLASAFESAAAHAGIELAIDCPGLPEAIFVDPEMWEKIVLNLLSNAIKYTHVGRVAISLRAEANDAVLRVEDSGVGIPQDDQSHIFERFYRARVTEGRSHEGTGIGLALVKELTVLHGGSVAVASQVGAGSRFTVRIPMGSSHLPADQVRRPANNPLASMRAAAFAEEARRWGDNDLPRPAHASDVIDVAHVPATAAPIAARVLVIDDNPDLRNYVIGLLAPVFRQIDSAADGRAGLQLARTLRPDVILSDVMMPRLDGFALVRELRADDRTRAIPVILLSARAGEESTADALATGANDYLIKPFSARELIARVKTHLEMARVRHEVTRHELVEADLRQAVQMRDDFLTVASHELRTPLTTLGLQTDALLRALRQPEAADPASLVRKAEVIRAQADHLAGLVEGMLDVSSIEGGTLQLDLAEVDLGVLARNVSAHFEGQARRTATPIIASTPRVVGHWDARRVTQLLTHLLVNALKFGKGKPVELRVEQRDAVGQLSVIDHGIGIAPEDHERIFERFERGVSERHYGGLGLGLWIVRQLVRAMGGEIRVTSAVGAGASFTIELPIEAPTAAPARVTASDADTSSPSP